MLDVERLSRSELIQAYSAVKTGGHHDFRGPSPKRFELLGFLLVLLVHFQRVSSVSLINVKYTANLCHCLARAVCLLTICAHLNAGRVANLRLLVLVENTRTQPFVLYSFLYEVTVRTHQLAQTIVAHERR